MARVSYLVNQHSRCQSIELALPRLDYPSADADVGPFKQRSLRTGCSDAVYLAVRPGLPCHWLVLEDVSGCFF